MAQPVLPGALRDLLSDLARLPGIGPKSAQRIVFSLLQRPAAELERFAAHLRALPRTTVCRTCGMLAESERCALCADVHRDPNVLCVVETPVDVLAIERSGGYHGTYHVLGGVLSPLEHIGPEHLNLASLLRRVQAVRPREVILALNPSTEGDTTALYLQELLAGTPVTVTRIAQGLPTGATLEFADDLTIARALAGRSAVRRA